jgi:hypothetical protein
MGPELGGAAVRRPSTARLAASSLDLDPDGAAERQAALEAEQREVERAGERPRHVAEAAPQVTAKRPWKAAAVIAAASSKDWRAGSAGPKATLRKRSLPSALSRLSEISANSALPRPLPVICISSMPLPIAPSGLTRSWQSRALTRALIDGIGVHARRSCRGKGRRWRSGR